MEKMEIFIAKTAGFCFGVKRAISIAYNAARESSESVYTLGPLIHNPQVVKDLEKSGVVVIDCLEDMKEGSVIIRSHGVTFSEMEEIKSKRLDFVDATCPFVKKAQNHVKELSREGYFILIVGEKDHPEVKGLASYAGRDVLVINGVEELDMIPKKKRIGIVAQTTQSIENLQAVTNGVLPFALELRIYNTICNATAVRQKEATELAEKIECMIVVGGYNSANTNRLVRMCRDILEKTYHIEVASEIKPEWLEGVKRVGISAGASTPPWIIEDVVKRVREIGDSY